LFCDSNFGSDPLDFRNLRIDKTLTFSNITFIFPAFLETDIRKVDFINCNFTEIKGRYVFFDETEYSEDLKKGDLKEGEESRNRLRQIEELYRAMKEQSRAKNNMYDYPYWHMSEKEMQRKRTPFWSFNGLLLNAYHLVSGYGEEPKRAAWWLFGFIVAAIIAISSFGIKDSDNNLYKAEGIRFEHARGHSYYLKLDQFPTTALYALETLTYVKTPEFTPANNKTRTARLLGRIFTTLQFTLFAFALRNRFRR